MEETYYDKIIKRFAGAGENYMVLTAIDIDVDVNSRTSNGQYILDGNVVFENTYFFACSREGEEYHLINNVDIQNLKENNIYKVIATMNTCFGDESLEKDTSILKVKRLS